MKRYKHSHLTDHGLEEFLADALRHERGDSAVTLSVLAEFDMRRLYLPAGYPSMFRYCIGRLHMSDDSALKRIRVARVGRQFRVIFPALAEGRINQSAVLLLKPYLTSANVEELLAAAAHRTNAEIALLLAERFPRPDVPTVVEAIAPTGGELAARPVETLAQLAAQP